MINKTKDFKLVLGTMKSNGNYVNLHIGARIYPFRATMTQLITQLEPQGFCRIHRSHAVRFIIISLCVVESTFGTGLDLDFVTG